MPLNNVPSPVRPSDGDLVVGYLADQQRKQERNVNDPNEWIYVGNQGPTDQPWAPDFQNGFFNVGDTKCLLRYRLLRPYDPTTTQNAVQIQGSVTGGSLGLTIFTLIQPFWEPDGTIHTPPFTMDADIHLTCQDDAGDLVQVTIQATGDVIYGFA